jgi:hypothetical protein
MKYILLILLLICLIVIYINFYYYPYIFKIKNTNLFYCHIPKTGGTSFIEEYLYNPFKISWHYPVINYPIQIQKKFIAIVRNPYSRLVSCYEFFNKNGLYYEKYIQICKYLGILQQSRFIKKEESFESFILNLNNQTKNEWLDKMILKTQTSYLKNKNNKIYCQIGKYETLTQDLSKLLNQEINLPKLNSTTKEKHWKDYYTPKTAQIVYNYYKEDFINFNYKKIFN